MFESQPPDSFQHPYEDNVTKISSLFAMKGPKETYYETLEIICSGYDGSGENKKKIGK